MKRIRVLLVDDQGLFREALATLLGLHSQLEIVGEAGDGEAGVALAQTLRPDVVLMDLRMPGMSGVEATRRLRSLVPEARVLVLTTFEDDDEVLAAIEAGAAGYMLKASPAEKLVEAICTVMRGGSPLEPSVASKVMAELARLSRRQSEERCQRLADPLSTRELEVLRALCEGLSNKEIAAKLGLTEGTVKNHMTQVLSKLGVLDRTQAALRAHALGLLKPGV
ncbi:MAG TPA: response regulator transcription factor [Opitutaceae bacterium]|nr:response regulator transcription factor [Opitutaceae bacterium]HOR25612.1 response regulator transcription factor [Opitutaceae bacterium]HPK50545.1 response regulator transcription factor [Opitutaceae bacterium]